MNDDGCGSMIAVAIIIVIGACAFFFLNSLDRTWHSGTVIGHTLALSDDSGTIAVRGPGGFVPIRGVQVEQPWLVVQEGVEIHRIRVGTPNYLRFKDGDKINFTINGNNVAYLPAN